MFSLFMEDVFALPVFFSFANVDLGISMYVSQKMVTVAHINKVNRGMLSHMLCDLLCDGCVL